MQSVKDIQDKTQHSNASGNASAPHVVRFSGSETELMNKRIRQYGFCDQNGQRAIRRTKNLETQCDILISPNHLDEGEPRTKMAEKYQDIRDAILAMNPGRTRLNILLPVGHSMRHGFPHQDEQGKARIINERLQIWSSILGLQSYDLVNLANHKPVTIKDSNGTELHFPVWNDDYLSASLASCMDELKTEITVFFKQHYQYATEDADNITPMAFLQENKPEALQKLIVAKLNQAKIDTAPLTSQQLNHVIQCILLKAVLYLAQQSPSLKDVSAHLASKSGASLGTDGTQILHHLYRHHNNDKDKLATEFAHEVVYIAEEVFAMFEKFKQKNYHSFYCGNHIAKYEPMRVIATYLNEHLSYLAIETCNSYETREQRHQKRLAATEHQMKGTSPEEARGNQLETLGFMLASLTQNGVIRTQNDAQRVVAGVHAALTAGATATDNPAVNIYRDRSASGASLNSGNGSEALTRSSSRSPSGSEAGGSEDEQDNHHSIPKAIPKGKAKRHTN